LCDLVDIYTDSSHGDKFDQIAHWQQPPTASEAGRRKVCFVPHWQAVGTRGNEGEGQGWAAADHWQTTARNQELSRDFPDDIKPGAQGLKAWSISTIGGSKIHILIEPGPWSGRGSEHTKDL